MYPPAPAGNGNGIGNGSGEVQGAQQPPELGLTINEAVLEALTSEELKAALREVHAMGLPATRTCGTAEGADTSLKAAAAAWQAQLAVT